MNAGLRRYLVLPILIVTGAQLLRSVLGDWIGPQTTPVQMFSFLAVFVCAWAGGFWAGFIASVLSVVGAYAGVVAYTGQMPVLTGLDYFRVALFMVISIVFSVMTEARLRDRRRTEDLLREIASQKSKALVRMHELADSMPQIVFSCGADGRWDYFNARWYELTRGLIPDGKAALAVCEDDRERATRAWQQAMATEQPFEIELRLQFAVYDNEPRWYLSRALPVRDDHGRVVRWYGTTTDIHDQKMAEAALTESRERLRAALDASVTGTFRWDIHTNELDWDDNLDRLFGLAPGSTAQSLPEFIRMVHPDDRQRVADACRRCADGSSEFEEEFRVTWPDGTVRWLYDKGRVYETDTGTRCMAGACVDVTERRQKEDALRAADRQKDEFLGMLSHEIRNPLAPMMYAVGALERQLHDPRARRPLEVIGRQVRRMVRIVDDLLDVSRVTQGKISLQRERVRLAEVVAQAVDTSRPLMEGRNHALQFHIGDASLVVSGDAVRLGQILENLLVNAAKYTPVGGKVAVSVGRDDQDAVITVADTGVGIEPAMLTRVFDLFAQADISLDRAEGGLGIGLTLVDRLTRLHGGRVEAQSKGVGHGSSFVVRLPLLASGEAELRRDAPAVGRSGARTILIVDDNVDSAESLGALLEMNGHRVHQVHDGRAVIAAAREVSPDLMLLDIGLPGLDGFQVMRQIRTTPGLESLAVVAATGYGREEDRARCLAAGFDGHLTKPLGVADIERILSSLPCDS